ncbi:SEC-C metal-binding domain-containing protein [Terasakiella sp.]|uniref:SEC-C metal-binding domain-containing protein n=1 Tax=Terasakiella sp. TaxID=2034861 RepID=UPI003AA7CE69
MIDHTRSEQDILDELEALCASPGYQHLIAGLAMENNFLVFEGDVTGDVMMQMKGHDRLIRNEIQLLISLMVKSQIHDVVPSPIDMTALYNETQRLLAELHDSMKPQFVVDGEIDHEALDAFGTGKFLREPIFYGGEAAFMIQYLDLAKARYQKDEQWFIDNKGVSVNQCCDLSYALLDLLHDHLSEFRQQDHDPDQFTCLPIFQFSIDELVERTECDHQIVKAFVDAFASPPIPFNDGYRAMNDFSISNAQPFIMMPNGHYVLYDMFTLAESFYESPIFWLRDDKTYRSTAEKHRGDFTEEFSADRLQSVFGNQRIYTNVNILDETGNRAGEIDVLVVFADRAIILQAKSKTLTMKARGGDNDAIQADFKAAVQHAYDQGYDCAKYIQDETYRLVSEDNTPLPFRRNFAEIFVGCIVADNYPMLAMQVRQFLKYEVTDVIRAPYVFDVFYLDALCEFLDTPLHFLNFMYRRSLYVEKVASIREFEVLAYHLKYNLYFKEGEFDWIDLGEDFGADLDASFHVRRQGWPGERTPDGLLTRFADKPIGYLLAAIGECDQDGMIDLGYHLLEKSEDALGEVNDGLVHAVRRISETRKTFTISFGTKERGGLTVLLSYMPYNLKHEYLLAHCEMYKYKERADKWFGLAIAMTTGRPFEFGGYIQHPWEYDSKMEEIVRQHVAKPKVRRIEMSDYPWHKVGRNDPCPCGSGKKFKKCCRL